MRNSDMPAMPHTEYSADGNMPKGLTKREHSVIKIMAGLASHPDFGGTGEDAAKIAIDWTDAAFRELEKERAA